MYRDRFGRFVLGPQGTSANLEGRRFGRLVVLRYAGRIIRKKSTRSIWKCRCDCGRVTFVATYALGKDTRSCGCLKRDVVTQRMKVHGHTQEHWQSRTYSSWGAMKNRCLNPSQPTYRFYGGRGVKVCRRWMTFKNFLADMGPRPEGTTLGRFMDRGNYKPGNVAWMTREQQKAERQKRKDYEGSITQHD